MSHRPQTAKPQTNHANGNNGNNVNGMSHANRLSMMPSPLTRPKTAGMVRVTASSSPSVASWNSFQSNVNANMNGTGSGSERPSVSASLTTAPSSTHTTQRANRATVTTATTGIGTGRAHSATPASRPMSSYGASGRNGGWSGNNHNTNHHSSNNNNSNAVAFQTLTSSPARALGITAPPPHTFTPFTPNVPFNSFTPFTGPYTYLATNVPAPTQTSNQAHIDWLRIEVLRRDIRVLSQAIQTGIDTADPIDQQQLGRTSANKSNRIGPTEKTPSFAPLPMPLLSQLGGASFVQTLSTRSLKLTTGEEEKHGTPLSSASSTASLLAASPQEQLVPTSEWQQLVERALQRFGHSSDYLSALTSTVGLLEVWAVQMSRMLETAQWMSQRQLRRTSGFQKYQQSQKSQSHKSSNSQSHPATPPFSFAAILTGALPVPVPVPAGADSESRLLGNSSSTSSLALSSVTNMSESSLFHALPSLAKLLDHLHHLTAYANYTDARFAEHHASVERLKKESRAMRSEIELLTATIREAAEDRPKQRRVIHQHVPASTLTRNESDASQQDDNSDLTSEQDPISSSASSTIFPASQRSTRPPSASASATAAASSPSSSPVSRTPLRVRPGSPLSKVCDTRSTPDTTSLHHEISLLRASLEDERRQRVTAVATSESKVADRMHAMSQRIAELELERDSAERRRVEVEASLATQTETHRLAVQRLHLQLTSTESQTRDQLRADMTRTQEHEWEERLAAERKHRDEVEKHRWQVHVAKLSDTEHALAKSRDECRQLTQRLATLEGTFQQFKHDADQRQLALTNRWNRTETDRQNMIKTMGRENESLKKYEDELVQKKAKLDKELKSKSSSSSADDDSAKSHRSSNSVSSSSSTSSPSSDAELNRVRREVTRLTDLLRDATSQCDMRAKAMIEHEGIIAELRAVIERRTEEADKRTKEFQDIKKTSEEAILNGNDKIRRLTSEIETLQQRLLTSEGCVKDAEARLHALQTEYDTLRKQHTQSDANLLLEQSHHRTAISEIDTLKQQLQNALARVAGMDGMTKELKVARDEIERLETVIRGLEARLAAADAAALNDHLNSPTASLTSPSRSASQTGLLSPSRSPSTSTLNNRRPTTPLHVSKDEKMMKELDALRQTLERQREKLTTDESEAMNLKAILEQQRAELVEEQKLLQSAASILHSDLLSKLLKLLPLNFAAIDKLARHDSSVQLVPVDELRTSLRHHTELTDAIHSNLTREIAHPPTKLHQDSLGARLEALRRACEFHENRLNGLSPSVTASTSLPSSSSSSVLSATMAKSQQQPILRSPVRANVGDNHQPSNTNSAPTDDTPLKRVLFGDAF